MTNRMSIQFIFQTILYWIAPTKIRRVVVLAVDACLGFEILDENA